MKCLDRIQKAKGKSLVQRTISLWLKSYNSKLKSYLNFTELKIPARNASKLACVADGPALATR